MLNFAKGHEGLNVNMNQSPKFESKELACDDCSKYWKNYFGFWTLIKSFNFEDGSDMLLLVIAVTPFLSNYF